PRQRQTTRRIKSRESSRAIRKSPSVSRQGRNGTVSNHPDTVVVRVRYIYRSVIGNGNSDRGIELCVRSIAIRETRLSVDTGEGRRLSRAIDLLYRTRSAVSHIKIAVFVERYSRGRVQSFSKCRDRSCIRNGQDLSILAVGNVDNITLYSNSKRLAKLAIHACQCPNPR